MKLRIHIFATAVSSSAIKCLESLVSEMTYIVSTAAVNFTTLHSCHSHKIQVVARGDRLFVVVMGLMYIFQFCHQHVFCLSQDQQSLRRRQGIGDVRRVRLHKEANEGLGVSITVSIAMICYFIISY